jgi:hypothetical protein
MSRLLAVNLGLRFLIELAALAALGYWGSQAGRGTTPHVLFAISAPLGAAVIWGAFVAPKAAVRVSEPVRLAIELLVYAAATAGLAAADQTVLAIIFAVAAVANSAAVRLLSGKGEARGQAPDPAV